MSVSTKATKEVAKGIKEEEKAEEKSAGAMPKISKDDKLILEEVACRVHDLKEHRKQPLPGIKRSIEDVWRDADLEFTPHDLSVSNERPHFEANQEDGLRSRLVKVGDEGDWQSSSSSADFYVKVSTAVSILIDMNPEAVFEPTSKKYKASTKLVYNLWKQSWESSLARTQVKKFSFNLAKYGFAVAKTYPLKIDAKKKIFNPVTEKFETKTITKYNDLCRKNLSPWNTWFSPMATYGDPYSINDWYYEVEYDEDTFKQDFPVEDYPNAEFVKPGMVVINDSQNPNKEIDKSKSKTITVGFYENQVRDQFLIFVPSAKIPLYTSPLPNDDGMLSCWFAPWSFRDDRSIYGIGIYEIIRNDKILFDKLSNMTMDQLTLSIYKMFFYRGVDVLGENGELRVTPGVGSQIMDPQSISWMNVPGPGPEAWKGMEWQKSLIDDNSGVPQQLSGRFAGRTLGQDLQAKETALERMKAPLDFICDALQQEAYISLSWMKQIYSTPEVLTWEDEKDLGVALEELGLDATNIKEYLAEAKNPKTNGELLYQTPSTADEEGMEVPGEKKANVYREFAVPLERDEGNNLIETEDKRFFRVGLDVMPHQLDWKGIVRIKPQSILVPSKELSKRNDLDLFNLIFPSIQKMAEMPQFIPVLMPPIKQIIEVYDKDAEDWVDEPYFMKLFEESQKPKESPPEVKSSLSVAFKDITPVLDDTQKQILEKYFGIKVEEPLLVDKASGMGPDQAKAMAIQAEAEANKQANSSSNPKEGVSKISPVADLKPAPTTLGGAVEGATNMV